VLGGSLNSVIRFNRPWHICVDDYCSTGSDVSLLNVMLCFSTALLLLQMLLLSSWAARCAHPSLICF